MVVQSYGQKTFADGETIFKENEPALTTYLVKSGKVRLWKRDGDKVIEIAVIGKDSVFGEMAVLSDDLRMASATAVGEVLCLTITQPELIKRLDDLSDKQKQAFNFLIQYCREYLPFELHRNRPHDEDTKRRDKIARKLVANRKAPPVSKHSDAILAGLYQALIDYADRRLPPP